MEMNPADNMNPPAAVPHRFAGVVRGLRVFGFFLYYLAIIILLLWIYGRGDTPTAPFVYQGF
jgi:hypothetical protein